MRTDWSFLVFCQQSDYFVDISGFFIIVKQTKKEINNAGFRLKEKVHGGLGGSGTSSTF